MKQIYYSIITLIRGKSSNLIKVISLSLGLFVGLILMARVTFELGFDKHYHEADKLMIIKAGFTIGGEKREYPTRYIFEPLPRAIQENFPDEIESATVVCRWASSVYYNGNHKIIDYHANYADSLYFHTVGVDILTGDPRELGNVDVMFICESLAKKLFGKENPIGRVLNMDKDYPLTVRGVFKDIPENSTLRSNIVISFSTLFKRESMAGKGWGENDSFLGFVRLKSVDPSSVNNRLGQMVEKYMPDNGENGYKYDFFLDPIVGDYASDNDIKMMIIIMALLAVVVLVIAALNYVLVSISSLNQRAKAIGVHKCSGASGGNILSMFLIETSVLILLSLLIMIFFLLNFKDWIEDMVFASLDSLFTLQTLWVPGLIILIIFLLVGLLPGQIMARLPVSHVFRRYTDRKNNWKKPLLFVQFTGASFIAGLLMVILVQHDHILRHPLGYNPTNMAIADARDIPDAEFLKDELRRMPMVEQVAISVHDLMNGWGALPVSDPSRKHIFTTRWNAFDPDYLPLAEIELVEGKNFDGPGQILINQKFIESMKMQESPIGKPLTGVSREGIVVGVMKDFPIRDRYGSIPPVMVQSAMRLKSGTISVRVRELNTETLAALNQKMEEMYPQEDIHFISMDWRIREQYEAVRRFRDGVVIATIVIILITMIGLIGYTHDEIRRRSKEIAIRKVNGAEISNILSLFTGNILWLSLPAAVIGVMGSFFIGNYWLDQFYEKVTLQPGWFILVAITVLCFIFATVVLKAWKISNENPVKSIKSE